MKKGLGRGLGAILGKDFDKNYPRNYTNSENANPMDEKMGTSKDGLANKNATEEGPEETSISIESSADMEKTEESSEHISDSGKGHTRISTQSSYPIHQSVNISISLIEPRKDQPRKSLDEASLGELADSIRLHGLLQPILLRKKGLMYEIIAGERRWRAAKLAGLKEIPALIRNLDDKEVAEAALIENIQRENLNSIEEARAYRSLIDDYGLTQEELANRLSRSRSAIANSLRLLNLDDEILNMLERDLIQAGHARAILSIDGGENQLKAARLVADKGLSVRDTEKLAKKYVLKAQKAQKQNKEEQNKEISGDTEKEISDGREEKDYEMYLSDLAGRLTEAVNTKVSIKSTGKHKGHINIEYYSDEELNEIAERLM